MTTFVIDLGLYLVGVGTLLASYLAFSPVTRDLVVFLNRDQQIGIFRQRRILWVMGIGCLGLLLLRAILGIAASPESGAGWVLGLGEAIGTAPAGWLWVVIPTGALLAVLFWATYVPVVMAPPRTHRLVGIAEADELLGPDSWVLGLIVGDVVRAYPRDLIARPHWFNDVIDGRPLMISYCILCNSGQAFVPEVKGRRLDLRNLTAYDNNTVYHDARTGNYIQQLEGKVIRGPDAGAELESYPVVMATWSEWKRLHPDTEVYYSPGTTLRDRVVDAMLRTMIPVHKLARRHRPWHLMHEELDERLPAMDFVFGVEVAGDACAYPVSALAQRRVVNDTVGGTELVVLYDAQRGIGQIFRRRLGDRTLTFAPSGEAEGVARDDQTGSIWDVAGRAVTGPLAGATLSTLPHYNQLFWFSWAAFKRGTRINLGEDAAPGSESPRDVAAG